MAIASADLPTTPAPAPAAPTPAVGGAGPTDPPASPPEERSGWAGLFRIFQRGDAEGSPSAPVSADESEEPPAVDAVTPAPDASAPVEPSLADDPQVLTLTQQDLDRRVQAEVDRREHKRRQELVAQQNAQLQAELRELRDTNPHLYAERMRELEDQQQAETEQEQFAQQTETVISNTVRAYDQVVLAPIVRFLPDADREEILAADCGVGWDGREKFTTLALERIATRSYEAGQDAAEKALRASAAFRKELMAELRGDLDQPEVVEPTAPTQQQDMNDVIRGLARSRRGG